MISGFFGEPIWQHYACTLYLGFDQRVNVVARWTEQRVEKTVHHRQQARPCHLQLTAKSCDKVKCRSSNVDGVLGGVQSHRKYETVTAKQCFRILDRW